MRALSWKSLRLLSRAARRDARVIGALLLCALVAPAYAQEQPVVASSDSTVALQTEPGTRPRPIVRSKSLEGLGPDAQLTGGIGFGFEAKLQNFFLARARLGVLYAAEPWIANLGFTAEVGALAGLGWGGELELSRAGTLFGLAGVSRVDESRWLAHLGIGFTIFGLEWQHVFGGSEPHNALLLEIRVPLGLWWLHKRQEKAEAESAAASSSPATPHIIQRPTSNPPPMTLQEPARNQAPALSGAASGGSPTATPGAAAASGAPDGAAAASGAPAASGARAVPDASVLDVEFAERMAEAQSARERGDHLAEAIALSRAYTLRPEPSVSLQLSAAELALARPRSALADWQRLGDLQKLSAEERARATQLRQQISANLAQLRLTLSGGLSAQDIVWIDGIVEPTANRGYDVPLDPGDHNLQVKRAGHLLIERAFHVDPGKLLRLDLELPHD